MDYGFSSELFFWLPAKPEILMHGNLKKKNYKHMFHIHDP